MIHAVATVFNERQIIEKTISHLYGEGVDHIWIADASTDGTRDLYEQFDELSYIIDDEPYHFQPLWINRLAALAKLEGATWIIPFDADEFWYAHDGRTIKANLDEMPAEIVCCHAGVWEHADWDHRAANPNDLGKIAFRPDGDFHVAEGNHHVSGLTGDTAYDVLAVREWQFQSLEHMHAKSQARVDRIDPALEWGYGTHQRMLVAGGVVHREEQWAIRQAEWCLEDPIPYRGTL